MVIEFYVKNVYGKELLYVKDEQQREIIKNLTNKETINDFDINNFKKLGIEFVEVLAPRKK